MLPDAIDDQLSIPSRTLNTNHFPTTDVLGWRCLYFNEVMSLRVCQSIIVILPTDVRTEDYQIKKERKALKKRLIGHGALESWDLRHDEVVQHLNDHHGVERNDSIYIELICTVKAYGERDDLMADRNLGWHLGRGNSGMLLDLQDYPSQKSFQIKPIEIPSVQFWVGH